MKVAIAADHGGVLLKAHLVSWLAKNQYEFVDFGPNDEASVDYPRYALKVVLALKEQGFSFGVLVCSTGTGMAIMANRFSKIFAANCTDEFLTRMAREHNDMNVLCLGQRTTAFDTAERILHTALTTSFSSEVRHHNRVDLIDNLSHGK